MVTKSSLPKGAESAPDSLDSHMLDDLVGYATRRAYLVVRALFAERMSEHRLKPVEFSVLTLLAHNPGATSRQLCAQLDILPSNFVSIVANLGRRELIERRPHPMDGRALGLHLTPAGEALAKQLASIVRGQELRACHRLTQRERETLIRLLQKIYL